MIANLRTKNRILKSKLVYAFVFWSVLTLVSCRQTPVQIDDDLVFRYNESANVQTLDPAFARNQAIIWPCNQLFNGLVQLDDALRIQPDIAESWTVSPDGKIYRFTLRDDVYFHEHPNFGSNATRQVVAADFVYSFDRLQNPKVASPGGWVLQNVAHYQAEGDRVLMIQLKESFPAFLGLLSMRYASVVPWEVTEDSNHDFRSNPIGTGPFYFKYWEENVKMVLRRNSNYFEKDVTGQSLPYLESVVVTFLPDKQNAFLQFIQGNLDFISGLDPSYKDDLITEEGGVQPKYKHQIKQLKGAYLNTEYLGFNTNVVGITQDIRIREALNIGFDRAKMLLYLRNGVGDGAIGGIVPKGLKGKSAAAVHYDPVRAKELVAAYKKETGEPHLLLTLATNASYLDMAEFLQREWSKIGLEVAVDVMPPATLRQAIATGTVPFFRASWIADYPDAENYLSLFYSKNMPPNGPNYTRYTNPEYDRFYEESFKAQTDSLRYVKYEKMDDLIAADVPALILFYDQAMRFTQFNIEGLGINPMNNLFLKNVRKQRGTR